MNILPTQLGHSARALIVMVWALAALATASAAKAGPQQSFDSPQAGVTALIKAVKASDEPALEAIFGPDGSKLLSSGDPVADAHHRAAFTKAFDESNKLVTERNGEVTLVVGKDEWPLPIPLVKADDGWRFDTKKGERKILERRIGRNELSAMKVCAAIVDAEREYAAGHLDSDGVPVYASRFISSPGRHDGLYWPATADQPKSPLGAFLAAAADEGYTGPGVLHREPYYGYYYRILTGQGENAPNGARDYFVKGKLIGGFAVLAYPARYGASGVTSFLVNHDGIVYEKDLGPETESIAHSIAKFNPSSDWKQVEQAP